MFPAQTNKRGNKPLLASETREDAPTTADQRAAYLFAPSRSKAGLIDSYLDLILGSKLRRLRWQDAASVLGSFEGGTERTIKDDAMRGFGRVFKRGSIYWIAYYHRGKECRESSCSESEKEARRLLKKRIGDVGTGRFTGVREDRITFEDLANAFLTDYQVNRRRSVRSARLSISHLRKSFGLERAIDITTDRVKAYARTRQQEGAANASINRELAALKRMFSLAVQDGRLFTIPHIPTLDEHNTRQGFIDHGAFVALRDKLPEYLRDPVGFLYLSGWRLGEMKALEWRDVDLAGKSVRLRPEVSKNKDGRVLPLSGELLEIVERAHAKRRLDCPHIFRRDGEPIGDFRKAWSNACKAAGLNPVLVHDLRRTAVRNMVRAGIPDRVAMALSGHKTRSIFDRYNIVSEADLEQAVQRLQSHLAAQSTQTKSTTIADRPKPAEKGRRLS
jgi:integrase